MLAEHLAFKSREINKRSLKMLSFRSHLTQKNEHEVENKHTNEMYVCKFWRAPAGVISLRTTFSTSS